MNTQSSHHTHTHTNDPNEGCELLPTQKALLCKYITQVSWSLLGVSKDLWPKSQGWWSQEVTNSGLEKGFMQAHLFPIANSNCQFPSRVQHSHLNLDKCAATAFSPSWECESSMPSWEEARIWEAAEQPHPAPLPAAPAACCAMGAGRANPWLWEIN